MGCSVFRWLPRHAHMICKSLIVFTCSVAVKQFAPPPAPPSPQPDAWSFMREGDTAIKHSLPMMIIAIRLHDYDVVITFFWPVRQTS